MKVIGFCNLKGGVGKTTACQNIAAALVSKGYRVAVLDMDPQSNLSTGYGITLQESQPYVYDFLVGEATLSDVAVKKEGVLVVPSSLDLAIMEMQLESEPGRDLLLKTALEPLIEEKSLDYLFCDSPPQLGLFTRNVLAAADSLFVPLESEFYSLAGLRLLTRTVDLFRKRLNKKLCIGGVALTRHNPKIVINRQVEKEAHNYFGDLFFKRFVRQNISIVEAGSAGLSIFGYDAESKGAKDYLRLAEEFLEKFGACHG
ncbi:MAG TPA: ParA family protein [Synergistaceae bacterium]|nr:ParA family protein [Synergistaceae bacterium]HPQ37456.1 ParA family protein [Synergistaceae bacterium]